MKSLLTLLYTLINLMVFGQYNPLLYQYFDLTESEHYQEISRYYSNKEGDTLYIENNFYNGKKQLQQVEKKYGTNPSSPTYLAEFKYDGCGNMVSKISSLTDSVITRYSYMSNCKYSYKTEKNNYKRNRHIYHSFKSYNLIESIYNYKSNKIVYKKDTWFNKPVSNNSSEEPFNDIFETYYYYQKGQVLKKVELYPGIESNLIDSTVQEYYYNKQGLIKKESITEYLNYRSKNNKVINRKQEKRYNKYWYNKGLLIKKKNMAGIVIIHSYNSKKQIKGIKLDQSSERYEYDSNDNIKKIICFSKNSFTGEHVFTYKK